MFRGWKWDWKQVVTLGIISGAFVATYFLPADIRAEMRMDLGWLWGGISTILGPLLRRELKLGETKQ